MKVVQINGAAFGSTGNIVKAIHRRLLAEGHDSTVFYDFGTATEPKMFRIGNDFALHSHAVLSRNLGKQGYFSHLPTLKLIRKLKKIQPDVVHLHNVHGSYVNLPMLFRYLKKSTARVVITLHDCWLFTGKCTHFVVAGCEKWKEHCGHCPQLAAYPRSKVDTTVKSLQDKKKWLSGFGDRMRVVAVSHWLRDTARQSFLAQYPVDTIYNGIDCTVFQPVDGAAVREKYGLQDKFVILGVSSNWNEQKGLSEFLQMAQWLAEDEVIVLVGLTETQVAAMPAGIVGITRTEDQAELAALYSAADVFVNTSQEETFGLVTVEAMACGTPVVVYDSTACAEVVSEGCGYVARPGDVEQVFRYIREAKEKPIAAASTLVQSVRERYTTDRMVEEYVSLYRGMVE